MCIRSTVWFLIGLLTFHLNINLLTLSNLIQGYCLDKTGLNLFYYLSQLLGFSVTGLVDVHLNLFNLLISIFFILFIT